MAKRVDSSGADVCFHLWSSAAFGACAEVETPVFAYAGNPDHYSMAARLKHPELFASPAEDASQPAEADALAARVPALRGRRRPARASLDLDRLRVGAERRVLHRGRATRARSISRTCGRSSRASAARCEPSGNLIAGNLGGQYATGNTFGGWMLATEVLPALDRLLGDDYEVQLFGAGIVLRAGGARARASARSEPRVRRRHRRGAPGGEGLPPLQQQEPRLRRRAHADPARVVRSAPASSRT